MRTILAGMAVLYAGSGSAQQPDRARLHRPGERSATTQDARQGLDTDAEAQIRRRSSGALGRRVDAADGALERQVAAVPNRRQNNRVLGRIDTRLSTRITGPTRDDSDVTDGVRRGTAAPR